MDDINSKGLDASPKEKNLLTLTFTAQVQQSLSLMETD
ncbi:hypothetical protein CGLO_14092 [Colletotrichum gloeosporioides Cg-14]|uniref:Uncharacterized protein n=1 Tax=Colletotrichum gloeosporioides (strain Cg-14) TaxID=1237896 RepID=T0K4I9_COLGC|nr:hypothetical protein CGLO_14092 [Colletotrichum gloeosporioides Cg-14]